jgi:hypothetical protein
MTASTFSRCCSSHERQRPKNAGAYEAIVQKRDEVSQLPARDRSGNQGAGMVERVALRAGQASTICRGRLPAHAREWDDLDAVA